MNDSSAAMNSRSGSLVIATILALVHLLAFGMLYLMLVQIHFAIDDFYSLSATRPTPEFRKINHISNLIAAYTPVVLLLLAIDLLIIFRLARSSSRWTSSYSHVVLLSMGFAAFLWSAWGVTPMARQLAGQDGANAEAQLDPSPAKKNLIAGANQKATANEGQ